MLSDHININLKRGVQIITCEPAERKIEAETRNGEVISINAYHYSPIFRWPVPGEKWVVSEENGSWFLTGIYEEQNPKEELSPKEKTEKERVEKEKAEREKLIREAKLFECGVFYPEGTIVIFGEQAYRKTNND